MASMTFQPVAVVNDPQFGSVPWPNPDGFRVKNFGEATANLSPGDSTQFARATYDVSALPTGVTLVGVGLRVRIGQHLTDVGSPGDASVRIGQAGTTVGDDKARTTQPYPIAPVDRVFGGPADLWNSGLDADSVRASGIEAFFAARWQKNPNAGDVADGLAKPRGDEMELTLHW